MALFVVGCGGGQGSEVPGGSPGADLVGRTFLSTSVTEGGRPRELVAGTKVSLWFAEDGRLVANAGCNTLTGRVALDGGKLQTPDGLSMTEMGCDAPRHAQDEWLAGFLQSGPSWRLDGDELILTSGDTELVLLDRSVAEPAPPVEGTKWLLETIYAGETASSVPPTGAHLIFADGRVTGSTGCNSLGGPATITGSNIEFGPIGMTRKACPDEFAHVEPAMIAVLQGTVPFEIEPGRLTLNPGAQQGLGFRG